MSGESWINCYHKRIALVVSKEIDQGRKQPFFSHSYYHQANTSDRRKLLTCPLHLLILHCVLTMRDHGHGRKNDNNIQLSFNISSNGSSISEFYINNLIIKSPALVVGSGFTFPGNIKFFVSSTKSGITPVTLIIASHSLTFAHEEGVDFGHAHVGAGAERWIN